jgi:phage tail protein X
MAASKRGRKPSCNYEQRRHIASLVNQHTASRTQAILAANPGTALAKLRNARLFPKPVKLSVPTLCRYARDHGVELNRGRRSVA